MILKLKFNHSYRTIPWWIRAIYSYFSIIFWKYIGNYIYLRKSKLGIADMLKYTYKEKYFLYNKLIKKYKNEFKWIEKYLDTNQIHAINELGMVAHAEYYRISTVWYYDLTIEDCQKILSNGVPISTIIYLKNGFKHSLVIIGCNIQEEYFIVHDPLGDYFSNYLIWYGAYVEFPFKKFLEISAGKPIMAFLLFPKKKMADKVLKHITKKQYSYP